jgi:hypothetical protein
MGWQRVTQSCCIGQEKKSAYLHIPARHLLQLSIIPVVCKGRGDSMTNQPSFATQQQVPGFQGSVPVFRAYKNTVRLKPKVTAVGK